MGEIYRYIEKLSRDNNPKMLNLDNSFRPTQDLYEALESFFINTSKGIHIAIVCADASKFSICPQETFFSIPSNSFLQNINNLNRKETDFMKPGHYYYCIEHLDDFALAFDVMANCAERLKIDAAKARKFIDIVKSLQQGNFDNNMWTYNNIRQFSPLYNASKGGANVRIFLTLPEKYFDFFQTEGYYFPLEFEHIVKGIPLTLYTKQLEEEIKQNKEQDNLRKATERESVCETAFHDREIDKRNDTLNHERDGACSAKLKEETYEKESIIDINILEGYNSSTEKDKNPSQHELDKDRDR